MDRACPAAARLAGANDAVIEACAGLTDRERTVACAPSQSPEFVVSPLQRQTRTATTIDGDDPFGRDVKLPGTKGQVGVALVRVSTGKHDELRVTKRGVTGCIP